MKNTLAVILAGVAIAIAAAAIGVWVGRPAEATPEQKRAEMMQDCLWNAIDAYPTWPYSTEGPAVVDTVEPCNKLSQADRTIIRENASKFVQRYTTTGG